MANIHYYELMQLVETQKYRHQEWRLLMCKKLEALRAYVTKHLGVESARYNDDEEDYVSSITLSSERQDANHSYSKSLNINQNII